MSNEIILLSPCLFVQIYDIFSYDPVPGIRVNTINTDSLFI